MGGTSGSLDKLLKAWGLQFDTSKVVADLNFKMQLRGPDGQPEEAPAWLGLTSEGINRDDIVTSQIDTLWLPMCGAFTGEPAAGLNSQETQGLARMIRQIRDLGITVVLVEHDMELVMDICDRIVVLNLGRKLAEGTPREIQENPEVIAAYLGEDD